MSHARFSPSAYERWSKCPGSLNLKDAHPEIVETVSQYAEEGTRLHLIGEKYLRENLPAGSIGDWEAVGPYVEYVRSLAKKPNAKVFYEQKVKLHQIDKEMSGTADAIVYSPDEEILYVTDYKGGSGVAVEAVNNSQMKIYALGALLTFTEFSVSTVVATIVQPRCFHPDGPIRSETYSALDLVDFWEDIRQAVRLTKEKSAPLIPGGHCKWCPVKAVCPAIHKQANEVARSVFSAIEPAKPALDLTNLSIALSFLPQLEAWIELVREKAYREACAGRPPKNWKLVEKKAHRKWEDETLVVKALENEFGISPLEMFEKKLRSPAQIEKLLAPEHRKLLNKLVKIESTGATLVPATDKRPEVLVQTAKEVFSRITHEET